MTSRLRRHLLEHYAKQARALPWRGTRNPYRIWISEVMLQQTRVPTVQRRYSRFLTRFPDVRSLARASEQEICEEWAGLGYYARARNLHAAAGQVVEHYGGRFPSDVASLRTLPGIGAYTAAAVASIAFSTRVAAIDGNVERVLARVLADTGARRGKPTLRLLALASELADCERPGDVNQSLMDIGATICTPRSPTCAVCPLRRECRGRAMGRPERYPPPVSAPERARLEIAFAWVESPRGGLWLERRPMGGLWSGLWQLPGVEGRNARQRLETRLQSELGGVRARIRHELTHRDVRATVFDAPRTVRLRRSADCRPWTAPLDAPLSALVRKAIEAAAP